MEIVYIIIIFILAGLSLDVIGFGVATISMSLLLIFMSPLLAIPLVAVAALVSTGFLAWRIKGKNTFKKILPLFFGVIIGVPLGLLILNFVNQNILRVFIGLFFIVYSIYGLFFHRFKFFLLRKNKVSSVGVGFFAGFFNSIVNVDGPLVALYEISDLDKNYNSYRDSVVTHMFFTGLLTVSGHLFFGRITRELIFLLPYVIPSLALGIFIGDKVISKLDKSFFKKIIYFFVLSSGMLILLNL